MPVEAVASRQGQQLLPTTGLAMFTLAPWETEGSDIQQGASAVQQEPASAGQGNTPRSLKITKSAGLAVFTKQHDFPAWDGCIQDRCSSGGPAPQL